jgi:hypothetical protein
MDKTIYLNYDECDEIFFDFSWISEYDLVSGSIDVKIHKVNDEWIIYGAITYDNQSNYKQIFHSFESLQEKEEFDKFFHIHEIRSEVFPVSNRLEKII